MVSSPSVKTLLEAAVAGIGGSPRAGQVSMAEAISAAVDSGEHLLVQAGTGTGKSLAYLVPAAAHAQATGTPVVVATATLALQGQIVDRDLPRLAESLRGYLPRPLTYGLVKGRRNYICVHKISGGMPEDDDDALFGVGQVDEQIGRLGQEVLRLRQWAQETESGDRDDLVPGVSERAWRQVSVSARECLGSRCPMREECFVEQARAAAADVDIVVTNHSFASIDAFEGRRLLPEHDLLVVDEAHELVDRVTATVTDELGSKSVGSAARKAASHADANEFALAGDGLAVALEAVPEGRVQTAPEMLVQALGRVHEAARLLWGSLKGEGGEPVEGAKKVARAAVEEIHAFTERALENRELDVLWVTKDDRRGAVLRIAPMSVAMQLREAMFTERTVVLTSATLELGGSFDPVAGQMGLRGQGAPAWRCVDVGSPFDYARQGIAYVADRLPTPGRDGAATEVFDEIEALIRAAGGRTLGLFSSMRAAKTAAEQMRERFGDDLDILCQGDDQLSTLVRQFASDASTCLFGTLSLWQGVDVPGSACQLVIIDRIPFPRPDDPLTEARTRAIGSMGGNGFMAVSATAAALKLAQGAGRLIRRADDRGVVAFLDPRMKKARYAGFLQASLPDMWPTTDRDVVLGALQRLDAAAAPVLPVAARGERAVMKSMPATSAPPMEPGETEHPAPRVEHTGAVDSSLAVTAGHKWDATLDEELRDGLDLGLDISELAEHLEMPPESIIARMKALKLS
ncbi:ATP-dependent DNA helicase [Dermatophilus congolensis]|uniref:ATP-dependent DNA helicase n=1 Tax=Dermatophilus congolensis TaxID=1863 RepID=UPI000487AE94|nr:ATP-dependent DNA helicase [Dermatophilus congolensis]